MAYVQQVEELHIMEGYDERQRRKIRRMKGKSLFILLVKTEYLQPPLEDNLLSDCHRF